MVSLNSSRSMVVPDFSLTPVVDQVGVIERVARFQQRSIKDEAKKQGLKLVLSMIDLTTLEGKDTEGKVKQLCYKAQHLHDVLPGLPATAAVCVYSSLVSIAKKELNRSLKSKNFYNYELIKGNLLDTLPAYFKENPHKQISLLHLDVDVYAPTKAILEQLLILKGGYRY